jgi:hypothetical protein
VSMSHRVWWWWWWWLLWSGPHDMQAIAAYVSFMRRQPQFAGIDWKSSLAEPGLGRLPFPDLVVKRVREIVSLGKPVDPVAGGDHLTPSEFHAALDAAYSSGGGVEDGEGGREGGGVNGSGASSSVVLLDVRNTFEHAVGSLSVSTLYWRAVHAMPEARRPNAVSVSLSSLTCKRSGGPLP